MNEGQRMGTVRALKATDQELRGISEEENSHGWLRSTTDGRGSFPRIRDRSRFKHDNGSERVRVSHGFENTADEGKEIETAGKNPERKSESVPMRITTRFGTRFATRLPRYFDLPSQFAYGELMSNPIKNAFLVSPLRTQRSKPRPEPCPNL